MHQKKKVKIALLLCAGIQTAHLVLTSVLSKLAAAFPETSTTSIQLVSSIASLTFIPFSFLAGRLASKISKRNLIAAGLIFILTGGLMPIVFHGSIEVLMLFTGVVGVGVGMISPTITSLFSDHFDGEERVKALGYQSAALSIGGMAFTLGGGFLGGFKWFDAYWIYLLVIPVVLTTFTMLPKTKSGQAIQTRNESSAKSRLKLNATVFIAAILAMLWGLCFNTFGMNISLYMNEAGITDTTLMGLANVVMMAGGFASGILFQKISKVFRKFTWAAAFAFLGAGFLTLWLTNSVWVLLIVSFLTGASNFVLISQSAKAISFSLDAYSVPMGFGIFLSLNHVGLLCSPIVITELANLMRGQTAAFRFGLSAILALAVAGALAVWVSASRKMAQKANPQT